MVICDRSTVCFVLHHIRAALDMIEQAAFTDLMRSVEGEFGPGISKIKMDPMPVRPHTM